MSWAAILAGLVKLFGAVADYFRSKQLIDAGEAKAKADTARKNNAVLVERAKTKADIDSMSDAAVDDELSKWTSPGRS